MAIVANSIIPLRHLLIIAGLSLVLMAPAFLLSAGGADLHCQSLWVKLFTAQFWQGEYYPRWLQDMYAGSGSPVFFYYPPLTYFITAFFAWLAPLDAFGYAPIAASSLLAVFLSGLTFYIWMGGESDNKNAALMGSLLYIAAPNHIAQNFYYAMLFSSVWSYVWVPLLMLYAKKIARAQPYAMAGFAVTLFLLIMTNLPMTAIFGPLAVAYSVLHSVKGQRLRHAMRLGMAIALGFGLSAIYLAPAIVYRAFTFASLQWKTTVNNSDYSRSNLFMGFDATNSKVYTLYLIVSVILLFVYWNSVPKKPARSFFLVASLAGCFMMLPVSRFLWDNLALLQMVQLAERFFAVTTVCLALFAALALPRLKVFSYALLALCIGINVIVAVDTRQNMESYKKSDPQLYENYTLNIDQYANYLTTFDIYKRYYSAAGLAEVKAHSEKVEVLQGHADVEVKIWRPRDIVLHFKASEPFKIRVRQFDFPGFRAFSGDQELETVRDEHTGHIIIDVAAGEGDIKLELTHLLPEMIGKILSILCAALVSLLLLFEMRQSQNKRLTSR